MIWCAVNQLTPPVLATIAHLLPAYAAPHLSRLAEIERDRAESERDRAEIERDRRAPPSPKPTKPELTANGVLQSDRVPRADGSRRSDGVPRAEERRAAEASTVRSADEPRSVSTRRSASSGVHATLADLDASSANLNASSTDLDGARARGSTNHVAQLTISTPELTISSPELTISTPELTVSTPELTASAAEITTSAAASEALRSAAPSTTDCEATHPATRASRRELQFTSVGEMGDDIASPPKDRGELGQPVGDASDAEIDRGCISDRRSATSEADAPLKHASTFAPQDGRTLTPAALCVEGFPWSLLSHCLDEALQVSKTKCSGPDPTQRSAYDLMQRSIRCELEALLDSEAARDEFGRAHSAIEALRQRASAARRHPARAQLPPRRQSTSVRSAAAPSPRVRYGSTRGLHPNLGTPSSTPTPAPTQRGGPRYGSIKGSALFPASPLAPSARAATLVALPTASIELLAPPACHRLRSSPLRSASSSALRSAARTFSLALPLRAPASCGTALAPALLAAAHLALGLGLGEWLHASARLYEWPHASAELHEHASDSEESAAAEAAEAGATLPSPLLTADSELGQEVCSRSSSRSPLLSRSSSSLTPPGAVVAALLACARLDRRIRIAGGGERHAPSHAS